MFPVDAFQNTLGKAAEIFRHLAIRFHLTGGVSSVLYGEPRMTQDINIVADTRELKAQLGYFLALLDESDFIFDANSVQSAVSEQSMFHLLDKVETLKLDIYARELIAGELDRSCLVEIFAGVEYPVVSRADAAASKLIWISKGSHKSRRDLRHIYRTASQRDCQRIRDLSEQLFLAPLLEEVLNEPDEIA